MALTELYKKAFTEAMQSPSSTPFRNGYYVGVQTKNGNHISIDANLVPSYMLPNYEVVGKKGYRETVPYRYFIKLQRDNHEIELDETTYEELVSFYEETVKEI